MGKLYLIIKELEPFMRKPKKAWEKLGKTILDNQGVRTIFDKSVRKTFLKEEGLANIRLDTKSIRK